MGARHSVQVGTDRRARSNSMMESNLQPPGPARRNTTQARHHSERDVSDDPEDDESRNAGSNTIHGSDGNLRISVRSPRSVAGLLQAINAQNAAANHRAVDRRILRFLAGRDVECPICRKTVPSEDAEVHIVMCFTRPKLVYNEEVLTTERGECSICLDDMQKGEVVARLECLCIFHKTCIDAWFKKKNVCPTHPGDD